MAIVPEGFEEQVTKVVLSLDDAKMLVALAVTAIFTTTRPGPERARMLAELRRIARSTDRDIDRVINNSLREG